MAKQKRKVGAGGKPPKKEPSDYSGWLKRAREIVTECDLSDCYECGFATAALVAFDKAIALRPKHPAAWYEKGKLLVRMKGRASQACGALLTAVNLDPCNARAWMWLGASAAQQGDWVAAREYLDRAVRLDPEMGRDAEWEYDIPEKLREPFFAGDPYLGLFARAGRL
jgi:tetratricopeptide (TPR) repeat protein